MEYRDRPFLDRPFVTEADDSQQAAQHADMENYRRAVSIILDKLDMGEPITSGEKIILREYCGIPLDIRPSKEEQTEFFLHDRELPERDDMRDLERDDYSDRVRDLG